jgi:hypothetical protein
MSRNIRIILLAGTLSAELDSSSTADAIWQALPLEGKSNVWGEEIYFAIPVELDTAPDARQVMEPGELAYWPGGSAFCIFFGPTPVSEGQEPRAYTHVNPFGRLQGDIDLLYEVSDGDRVRVERAHEAP